MKYHESIGFVDRIFAWVANALDQIAMIFGMTYNEINILCYYLLIPLSWTILFDLYIRKPYATAVLLIIWAGIIVAKWNNFSSWCDWLFDRSVDFLLWFNRWGGNYTLNSVVICVLIPVIIYVVLIGLLIWKHCGR